MAADQQASEINENIIKHTERNKIKACFSLSLSVSPRHRNESVNFESLIRRMLLLLLLLNKKSRQKRLFICLWSEEKIRVHIYFYIFIKKGVPEKSTFYTLKNIINSKKLHFDFCCTDIFFQYVLYDFHIVLARCKLTLHCRVTLYVPARYSNSGLQLVACLMQNGIFAKTLPFKFQLVSHLRGRARGRDQEDIVLVFFSNFLSSFIVNYNLPT